MVHRSNGTVEMKEMLPSRAGIDLAAGELLPALLEV
jgi:hypothetical protein